MAHENINTREVKVFGNLRCLFSPEQSASFSTQAGLTVEIWQKRPVNVVFLERGVTDAKGDFQIDFNINSTSQFYAHGEIGNVFIKVYYQGILISGANPYIDGSTSAEVRPLKGYTLRIGSNDLGSLEIDVTQFEFPKLNEFTDENPNTPEQQLKILFGAKFETGDSVPLGYRYDFSGRLNSIDNPLFQISQVSVKEEYVQLSLPKFSLIEKPEENDFLISLNIHGKLDNANEELFVKVYSEGDFYYSPVKNLILKDNRLFIKSEEIYYLLADEMDAPFEVTTVYLDAFGNLFARNSEGEYILITQIMFFQIENIRDLDIVSEGIYAANGETGEIFEGYLGERDTKFEKFSVTLNNPTPVNILIDIKIFEPSGENPIYTTTITGDPLSRNVVYLELDGELPIIDNTGPTLEDIELVSDTTFSSTLTNFINAEELNGLTLIKNAGPINYLKGLPSSGITEPEKELLQAHVDLFTVNENINENQNLILKGYNNLFDIANTPKDKFINDVTSDDLAFYKAVEIHEVINQNQKLLGNLLAARMTDYQLKNRVFPDLEKSNFAESEFASIINKCECDDCQSGISPFAYFVDLVKYGARHIRKTGSNPYYPVNYNSFFSLLENYFIQPFGNLSIDCDTLHDQFCRVRLVTEVLENHVEQLSLPQPVIDKLEDTRKKYLLLTYRTILGQAGTSYEELRDIVKTQPLDDKLEKAEKWSSKIGIPLTVTGTSELTADRIWLTFDNSNPVYELDGENLELIFGFRDTQRDVLTTPPNSLMDDWLQIHLTDLWRKEDYPFSTYSRENVDPTDNNSIKDNWLPIIDPDIIGRSDLTYLSLDFAKKLLNHRKKETDIFLNHYIKDAVFLERTSVDLNHKILRVEGRDITTHVIENDKIFIEETSSNFTDFNLLNRELVGLNTNVILKKSTPGNPPETAIFQPYGNNPVMQYNRVLNVGGADISIDENGPIIVTIDFNDQPLFQDVLSGGMLKLSSDNKIEVYANDSLDPAWRISNITYNSPDELIFVIEQKNTDFFVGNLNLVYEVEVPLFTSLIPNPEEICEKLFSIDQTYNFLVPSPFANSFNYRVWDEPSSWPTGVTGSSLFDKLKDLYQIINSGLATDNHHEVINNNLHLETSSFLKMMEILISCENYYNSMYTVVAPTEAELYGLSSIFRISAKHQLRKVWIIEEIKHDPAGGTNYIELMLDGKYFWKTLNEPQSGVWNPTLQTIPESASIIDKSHIPILDPEILKVEDLLTSPDAEPNRDLYFDRQEDLEILRDEHLSWLVPFNVDGFKDILNHINTGDENVDYDLTPEYADLEKLIEDFESTDQFRIHKAEIVLWEEFGITGADFGIILPIKLAYEANDPTKAPSVKELKTAVELLTSGYKRMQLYGDSSGGWIYEEVEGTFTNGIQVKYYNVLKMRMPVYRGSFSNRSEWQRTLKDWNRVPTIQPDIVPPENINNFVNGEIVHDIWVDRKDTIDTLRNDIATLFNESITPDSDLRDNYELLIAMAIARTDDNSLITNEVTTYLGYFLNLEELENAGVDVRPYLELYGINISAYRVLQSIYRIIKTAVDNSQPIDLLDTEYNNVVDILVAIHSHNIMPFEALQEEFNEDIILSGDDFQNYKPRTIEFPIVLLEEPNKWRSPHSMRKDWKNKLESRIDRSDKIKEEWGTVLLDTEEITMPVMRDALIEALRNNCESFEEASERLAKRFYIETKDNCCVKHSRVSFALETIQGFIFSLESGVYDDELDGFSISAPNFNKEWEWLGSYATWRSAVFTYIFPENLLYPTLKRLQSPQFRELSQTIQNANRFSSNDACKAARKFQDHFEDLQHLNIICTANAQAYFNNKDPFDCCEEKNSTQQRDTTFYFAQSKISGKAYWSEKPLDADDETQHSFWEELSFDKKVNLIGCYPLAREYDDNHQPIDLALWLFYTFKDKGEMKMAYIKKDLMIAGSNWGEENDIGVPDLLELGIEDEALINKYSDKLIKVTACQSSIEWDWPSFIFSFKGHNGNYKHIHVRYFFTDDEFDDKNLTTILVFSKANKLPITGVKHDLKHPSFQSMTISRGITVMFDDEIQIGFFGSLYEPLNIVPPQGVNFDSLIGCYFKAYSDNKIVVLERSSAGVVDSKELSLFIDNGTILITQDNLTNDIFIQNFKRVAPIFKQTKKKHGGFAIEAYLDNIVIGAKLQIVNNELIAEHKFGLGIEKVDLVAIQSGDCIDDFDLRIQNIKNHLRANLNSPLGNPIGNFVRTDKTKAYLYEAYYFVPMLIALDQQKRGQYEEALAWYRSVYDYANNITSKRRIFYGLKLEQSIANVYQRPADWLLDPLNPHSIAETRANAYTKYTLMNIIQCMIAYADREFTMDTIETVPRARKLYSEALALMKTSVLNKKPSACTNITYACLDQDILLPSDGYWNNSFSLLQSKLLKFNDVGIIENTANEVKSIFENPALNTEEKFSSAFEYIENNTPIPEAPETTSSLMSGFADQMNNASRFLVAGIDINSFNNAVKAKVGTTVGGLSKVAPEALGTSDALQKITWLKQPEKANIEPFVFEFTGDNGVQKLDNEYAYDPLVPYKTSYQANLMYTNANTLYRRNLYRDSFTPIINYRFCLPENPVYESFHLKANLELYKIHNCRNIAGMVRELDIFAAPTDSTTGVPMIGANGNLILPGIGNFTPSQYRFRVLIERAKQLVSQAQQLESQFLATLEKEDAERYSLMKARQDLQTAKSTVKLQDLRVKQANNELDLAELQLDKVEFSFDHFEGLISTGLIGFESISLQQLEISIKIQLAASIVGYAASATAADPRSSAASVMQTVLSGMQIGAQHLASMSSLNAQLASFARRTQEWEYQKELANFDIQLSNQQIKIAEDNIRIVSQERKISEMNTGHAEDTLEFLKTKFTNAELYRWMGNILERTYSYMLSLATAVARTAERQYYFEQQEQAGPFILDDYWEVQETGAPTQDGGTDRRGMMGSVRLLQDITRLDQFAFENTKRKLQITKTISLAQSFPEEFQSFRETGVLNFQLTNRMFDYDFPGQYLRLISGLKLGVIGLTPVYGGIKAMLTSGSTSYTVIEANNTFQRVPIKRLENEEIALSSPLSNNGLFELQTMQGQEMLNPFEGMGIESQWEFKMPKFSNRMDYSQIADIIVTVDYTALDNFQYRYQVLQDLDNQFGFNRGFSFKNDFPDQWYELAEAIDGSALFGVEFEIRKDSFPQGLDNIQLDGSDLLLHFVRDDGFTDEIAIADFSLANADPETEMEGDTLNGTFRAVELTNVLNGNGTPFVRLRLYFDNTVINRELFSEEKVQDILLLMSCKAELPNYPL